MSGLSDSFGLCNDADDAPLVYWWGNTATVVITQPEDAKCALMADVKHFKAVDMTVQSFLPLLGKGLLLADEATWRHHRSTLQPAFFAEKLKVAKTLCI
jgi:cytochrome P450